jgi:isoquinoline 1-oxidoreductase beta subunit
MLTRRHFLHTGALATGGLLVGYGIPARASRRPTAQTYQITAWVSIAADETATILCGSQEMGQGVFSGLAQIFAEELRVDWTNVQVGPAPVAAIYDNPLLGAQMTAGSSSVVGYFTPLLHAGAIARQMLI